MQQDHAAAVPITPTTNSGPVVGVDLGLTTLATGSDGTVVAAPRHLQRRLKTIHRQHRVVSRRQQGSQHRQQAVRMLSRLARRVANQRADTLQQLTTRLANTKAVIVIEELHVAGMLKNHRLAQAIADVGFSECRRQLCYKAEWYGSQVVVADRWYPSSKMCSGCGWVDAELTLADRVFRCRNPEQPACAVVLDRDLNAALKLAKLAGSSSERQNACGAGSAGLSQTAPVDLPVRMQEPDAFDTSVLER